MSVGGMPGRGISRAKLRKASSHPLLAPQSWLVGSSFTIHAPPPTPPRFNRPFCRGLPLGSPYYLLPRLACHRLFSPQQPGGACEHLSGGTPLTQSGSLSPEAHKALPWALCSAPGAPCSPSLAWLQPPCQLLRCISPMGLLWVFASAVPPAWNAVPDTCRARPFPSPWIFLPDYPLSEACL